MSSPIWNGNRLLRNTRHQFLYSSQHAENIKSNSKHQTAAATERKNFLFDNIYSTMSWGMCWNRGTIFILIRSKCTDRTVNTQMLHAIQASAKICSHLNMAKTQARMTLHNHAQPVKQTNKSLSQHLEKLSKNLQGNITGIFGRFKARHHRWTG